MEGVGEVFLGAAVSELVGFVKKAIKKHTDCPALLRKLDTTLGSLQPLIQEMEKLNRYLGRPKEEIESLERQVHEGITCVRHIYKSKRGKYIWSVPHQHKLSELDASLKGLYEKLGAQTARNGMETLLCTRMIFVLLLVMALGALLLLWSNGLIRLRSKKSPKLLGLKITEKLPLAAMKMDKAITNPVRNAERKWFVSVVAGGLWFLYKFCQEGLLCLLNLLGALLWACVFFGLALLTINLILHICLNIKSSWEWVKAQSKRHIKALSKDW
ncbi:unnamed protein product [Prunus armeniaca]|uniref:RPW8 domain-containing protein n=1 Tax=Prunus armeniaca TaxID=36596 RepID=A0A6J5VES9_PRUAR|nr:unnamed protein product [Prunus armeniaca]